MGNNAQQPGTMQAQSYNPGAGPGFSPGSQAQPPSTAPVLPNGSYGSNQTPSSNPFQPTAAPPGAVWNTQNGGGFFNNQANADAYNTAANASTAAMNSYGGFSPGPTPPGMQAQATTGGGGMQAQSFNPTAANPNMGARNQVNQYAPQLGMNNGQLHRFIAQQTGNANGNWAQGMPQVNSFLQAQRGGLGMPGGGTQPPFQVPGRQISGPDPALAGGTQPPFQPPPLAPDVRGASPSGLPQMQTGGNMAFDPNNPFSQAFGGGMSYQLPYSQNS